MSDNNSACSHALTALATGLSVVGAVYVLTRSSSQDKNLDWSAAMQLVQTFQAQVQAVIKEFTSHPHDECSP